MSVQYARILHHIDTPAMFYEGDLQSGITLAVSEAKHVICFVRGLS